jgi:galactokinase
MPLNRGTTVTLRPVEGRAVRLFSADQPEAGVIAYQLGEEAPKDKWADYVQGVTVALREDGHAVGGFDALLTTDLPIGAGVASSAALEIAMLRALRRAFGLMIDDATLANLAWRAETDFVGVPIGVMDQMACSLGLPGGALFLDTRSLDWEAIPLPLTVEVLVIDSGIPHRNADSGYRQRRLEVEEASRLLGVKQLRDVSAGDLSRLDQLPEPLRRRARHVVTENARVLAFHDAVVDGALDALGNLLAASHRSLRDDYEVSLPEIDALVSIANDTPWVLGARLTGGGFGGSVVVLAESRLASGAAKQIVAGYWTQLGRTATVISPSFSVR